MTLIFHYGHKIKKIKKNNMFFKKVQKWTKINVQKQKIPVGLLGIFVIYAFSRIFFGSFWISKGRPSGSRASLGIVEATSYIVILF